LFKLSLIVFITVLISTSLLSGQEVPFTQQDRERLIRLETKVEEGKTIHQRCDDFNNRFGDTNQRIKLMLLLSTLNGIKRAEKPEYPIEAIREAVINAVAHRDYSITGSAIRLFMFRDRLEIYSPGGLPDTLTIESIKLKQFARNQTIMSYLAGYNYTEQRGKGIIKMIEAMLNAGLPEPVFQDFENKFLVTFYNQNFKNF